MSLLTMDFIRIPTGVLLILTLYSPVTESIGLKRAYYPWPCWSTIDEIQCYPGICDGKECHCAPGFESPQTDCTTMTIGPAIISCMSTVLIKDGFRWADYKEVDCIHEGVNTVYTNLRINKIQLDWASKYIQTYSEDDYPLPDYMKPPAELNIGIVQAVDTWVLKRGSSDVVNGIWYCNPNDSKDKPYTGVLFCKVTDFNRQSFLPAIEHNDRLVISHKTTSGGYLKTYYADMPIMRATSPKQYYIEKTTVHQSEFIFDFNPPVHCSVHSACVDDMLDIGQPFTKQPYLSIQWKGWTDDSSGIGGYEYEIFLLKAFENKLHSLQAMYKGNTTEVPRQPIVYNLDDPGVYAVLLTCFDKAGGFQQARRFALFDNDSDIVVSSHDNDSIVVQNVLKSAGSQWMISLTAHVDVSWKNHFANEFHHKNKLLNEIKDDLHSLSSDYEQKTGQPPTTRSTEAIPNVNGIVAYEILATKEKYGAVPINLSSAVMNTVSNFQEEKATVNLDFPVTEGTAVRIYIKAHDVLGNTAIDSTLIHFDTSPPVIEDIGLSKHGETRLAVHSKLELYEMLFEFYAYDYHSGLNQVNWTLADKLNMSEVIASGHLPVHRTIRNDSACQPPTCYCRTSGDECYFKKFSVKPDWSLFEEPHGGHDFDYVFTVQVTNNVLMSETVTKQITVDITPPKSGTVIDSEPGQPDRDYQSSYVIHAYWSGFFDRESGVYMYRYGFHTNCISAEEFIKENSTMIHSTTNTFADFTVRTKGTFFATVVAFNHAMSPSDPVCSDGIKIDDTPPVLKHISVQNLYVKDGLVKTDSGDGVYYINRNAVVYGLQNSNITQCREQALDVSDMDIFKVALLKYNINLDCTTQGKAGNKMFITSETMLNVSWIGYDDESQLYDIYVGFSTTANGIDDVTPYENTHGHNHFTTYHPNLVNGQEFYIKIKASNKAGLQSLQTYGPVVVKPLPPVFAKAVDVNLQKSSEEEFIVITWNENDYDVTELSNGYIYSLSYAIGTPSCDHTLLHSFVSISNDNINTELCQLSLPVVCITIKVSSLPFYLHKDDLYCVIVKAEGVNYLAAYGTGILHYKPPVIYRGVLLDILYQDGHMVPGSDIDIQADTHTAAYHFYGFQHDYSSNNTVFTIGLGTVKGTHDITSQSLSSLAERTGKFEYLSLNSFETYYISIVIKDIDTGEVQISSSDGFMVIPDDTKVTDMKVYIGELCNNTNLHRHYQIKSTTIYGHWTLPDTVINVTKEIHIGVQQKFESRWLNYQGIVIIGTRDDITLTNLQLEGGTGYRLKLTACFESGCFKSIYSDGITIISDPPIPGQILEAKLTTDQRVNLLWKEFLDPYTGFDRNVIDFYEISIYDEDSNGAYHFMVPWTRLEHIITDSINHELKATFTLPNMLEASECIKLAIRAHNVVELYSYSETDLVGCTAGNKHRLVVIDAVAGDSATLYKDITLETNKPWLHPDQEFTSSTTSLHAVWPSLRHGSYSWKVVSSKAIQRWAYFKWIGGDLKYEDFSCSSSEVIACGHTSNNYINVRDLTLEESNRYYICVKANETVLKYTKWEETLQMVSECSNGIVVDTTAPVPGQVWFGKKDSHRKLQVDNTHLAVYWTDFHDSDIETQTGYNSTIKTYKVAIGTYPEGVDVQGYTDVGITNFVIIRNLTLQNGKIYFASVQAIDFAGLSANVSSYGITIDYTTPTVDNKIEVNNAFFTPHKPFVLRWENTFNDRESGIEWYTWCVGSSKGLCDKVPKTTTVDTKAILNMGSQFMDGHVYTFMIEATNVFGLTTTTSVNNIKVDTSPPVSGNVIEYDGEIKKDIDYIRHKDRLFLTWEGFSDPHVPVESYTVTIGSCKTCDEIMKNVNMGLQLGLNLTGINLIKGKPYYTRVKACNYAGLCSTAISDGLTVDDSPPHLGALLDGNGGTGISYQSSRDTLAVHFATMFDEQSGTASVLWWAGTSYNRTEVLPVTKVHLSPMLWHYKSGFLPVNKTMFATAQVCNKAGLCSLSYSNGFLVDTTKPVVVTDVHIMPHYSSIVPNTQIWMNVMHVKWEMVDYESPITQCVLSVSTKYYTDIDYPPQQLFGNPSSHIFSNMTFHDGEIYTVKVVCCNAARLCSMSITPDILIDGSPPTSGAFAIDTEHAIELKRHREDWMTYNKTNPASVALAWIGFQDAHSGIKKYFVKVGSSYHGCELCQGGEIAVIAHCTNESHKDEGYLQKVQINTSHHLQDNEMIYLTIWAQNGVGLNSTILHGKFITIPTGNDKGYLQLIRRCDTETCIGHCTCVPHGIHTCVHDSNSQCFDVTGNNKYSTLSVHHTTPGSVTSGAFTHTEYITDRHTMSVYWNTDEHHKLQPVWYEWSVSVHNQQPGYGLLNHTTQPVWFDNGENTVAVFQTDLSDIPELQLDHHQSYSFHVKSWYNDSHFALYKSNAIKLDPYPPKVSIVKSVIDIAYINDSTDIDFVTPKNNVAIKWTNVFSDLESGMASYTLSVGTWIGLDDVYSNVYSPGVSVVDISGLELETGVHYFATVTGCDKAGLCSTDNSDGFVLDDTPPSMGIIQDGLELHDLEHSSKNDVVSSKWKEFYDDESFIDHYEYCAGSDETLDDIVMCQDVGIQNYFHKKLNANLLAGSRVYSRVCAVNGAGIKSEFITTNGVTIDTTPPVSMKNFNVGNNIIKNPLLVANNNGTNVKDWIGDCNLDQCFKLVSDRHDQSRMITCITNVELIQSLTTKTGSKYRVSIELLLDINKNEIEHGTAYLQAGNLHQSIKLLTSNGLTHLKHYFFKAKSNSTTLKLGSKDHKFELCVQEIKVQELSEGERNEMYNSQHPFTNHNGPVYVHLRVVKRHASLSCTWDMYDLESPIDYSVAVGTVKGGIQIQTFKSTGQDNVFFLSPFKVAHNSSVYVTVVGTNAAGLNTVIYSDPHVIDLTPPVITHFEVNYGELVLNADKILVTWASRDVESNIEECSIYFACSTDNNMTEAHTVGAAGSKFLVFSINDCLGKDLITKLKCTNFAGLTSEKTSMPIKIATQAPSISSASLKVVSVPTTHYLPRDNYVSGGNLWVSWSGIHDRHGLKKCTTSITESSSSNTLGTSISRTVNSQYLEHFNFSTESDYIVKVNCTNLANLTSENIIIHISTDNRVPRYLGGNPSFKWLDSKFVKVLWGGLFHGSSSLIYDIHMGTVQGSADIMKWFQTAEPEVYLEKVDSTKPHYLTITAINKAGLFITKTFKVI